MSMRMRIHQPAGSVVVVLIGTLALMLPPKVQTAAAVWEGIVVLDEIIVTAQKREQNLQEVGVSVTAFTGEQVDAFGWDDSLNIGAYTPGLVTTSNTGDTGNIALFSVRGVSQLDFAEGQEAPVAIYYDDVYVSTPGASGFPLFDIDRVEVLRGPQGTLYGRNATGGLVHFVSNKPTDEFEAEIDLTHASYEQIRFVGAISGPLTDAVQGRLAVYSNTHEGYVSNAIGEDRREGNTQALRAQLHVAINDRSSLLVNARLVDIDEAGGVWHTVATKTENGLGVFCSAGDTDCGDGPNPGPGETFSLFDVAGGQVDDGIGDELDGAFNLPGGVDRTTWGITLNYQARFEHFSLTSISDYSNSDKAYLEDDDALSMNLVTYEAGARIDQFSQEVRLSGDTAQFNWIVGGYYLNIQNDFFGAFQFPAQFAYLPRFDGDSDTESWALFGQLEYQLTNTISLAGGLRYNSDKKTLVHQMTECDVINFDLGAGFCPANLIRDPAIRDMTLADPDLDLSGLIVDGIRRPFSRKDNEVSGKVQIGWRPNDDMLYYLSFSRGTKGGGFNTPTDGFATPDEVPFKPEILHAYEIGVKTTWWDGRARLNASAYYYDYRDFQAFYFLNTTSLLVNSDATFYGGEAELYLSPGDGWELTAGLALMDTEVNGSAGPGIAGGIASQEAPLAPNISASFIARKAWALGDAGGRMAAQVSASYTGENHFNIVNAETTTGGDYWLVDTRLTYISADDQWEVSLFVNNVFDERPVTYSYDISGFGNYSIFVIGPPRWIGGNIKYYFN